MEKTLHTHKNHEAFLRHLSEALRPLTDPVTIKETAARLLGQHLQTNRVIYFEVVGANYVAEGGYADGVPTIDGRHPIEAFGPRLYETCCSGRTACDADTEVNPELSPAERAGFAGIQTRAYIDVPLIKGEAFTAGLAIHSAEPRAWTDAEIELACEVAERTWAAAGQARSEAQFSKSQARYRLLVDGAVGFAIIELDLDGRVALWNVGAKRILGYAEEEIIGEHFACFFTPEDRDAGIPEAELEQARKNDKKDDDNELVRKDGNRFWANGATTALRDTNGVLRGYAKIVRDVSDRKQSEQSRARLAAIVESSDDAIISKNLDGIIQTWNAAAQRLFGYTAEEAVGQSITLLIPADRIDEEDDILRKIRRGERIKHFETVRHCKDGAPVDVSLTISPIIEESGRVIGASKVARDISERLQFERALRESGRRKDDFLATLAHELRNPLAPLRNGLEVMRRKNPRTMDKARALMERQLTQLTHLVDDLMDVSRITRGKVALRLASTNLAAVIRDAVETTRPRMDTAGHTLRVALPDEPVTLQADADRLTQVLNNLLTNAAKYTPEGGQIDIGLEQHHDAAVIRVRDNGIGLAADELGQIFDMFTQAGQPEGQTNEGLGIGLTLAKQLVELHGGTVEAHSDGPYQGSVFTLRLPLTDAEPEQTHEEKAAATESGVLRLLVVDDNPDVADSMQLLLDSLGHEVQVVHDGYQALDAIAAFGPNAVFLDLGLPGIDGFETAKRMRATPEGRNVTLIALTGWGREEDISRTTAAGFDHHLVKPVEPHILERLLAEL